MLRTAKIQPAQHEKNIDMYGYCRPLFSMLRSQGCSRSMGSTYSLMLLPEDLGTLAGGDGGCGRHPGLIRHAQHRSH